MLTRDRFVRFTPILSFLILGWVLLSFPTSIRADEWTNTNSINAYNGQCTIEGVATLLGFECLIGNVLPVVLRLIGIGTFFMIIWGGFKYLTSGGDPKATEAAQNTITYGIIGLVVAIAAWIILNLIKYFTGADVTTFRITTF